ncbi:hypothetical protein Ancab_031694 [Ancistrocladus abbreviatus]
MAQKHLKELLKEDQEPFHLNNYIADRRSQLKNQPLSSKTKLQIKKSKLPISTNVSFPSNFCKNACLFSSSAFIDSPDPRKSPLFDFSASPAGGRSPFNGGGSNALFLHVPAKTAALLLEAAMRIQKQNSKPKNRPQVKNSGLGLLGSMLKRLTNRNRSARKPEILNETGNVNNARKSRKIEVSVEEEIKSGCETGFCNGRLSSVWSESNNGDNKSLDSLESRSNSCCSSSSGRSFEDEEEEEEFGDVEFVNSERENGADFAFCLSPWSPFRFALYTSPSSPDRRSPSPGIVSPPISPARRTFEENVNNEQETTVNFHEDEEDKEQNSPVSVLDPPFDDDDDEGHGREDAEGDEIECSYAYVQRAKQQLLHKLRRFEKLAELDPVELEKRLAEEEEEGAAESSEPTSCEYEGYNASPLHNVFYKLNFCDIQKPGMKRLISHLVVEEERRESCLNDQEAVLNRVFKRLESWKEVESNTINMMVEMDLRRDSDDWRNPKEQTGETAKEIEYAIFAILVDEMLEELI